MYEAFIDLDELIVRCRDKVSRKFVQEAVSCYRAGAFRSCIVATWNAVVFDFLHKLRELELLGDREAAKLLEEFEKLRSSGKKFKELWQFESNIPEIALTKFELISTVEKSDIERLFEDRSRCAHPSMTSLEEPFEATAELARYHLRSAVKHLLERPPVQGRAARERIFQDIKSEYFPIDSELAIKYFQKSPLAHARLSLIKNVVIGLTKDLLTEDRPEDERLRQLSALNAVSSMYPQETRDILNDKLSDIILNVTDENWDKAIIYLGSVSGWDSLSEPCRLKAEAYIDKIDRFETSFQEISQEAISILVKASHIDFLRSTVTNQLQIPPENILSLKETCKDDLFKEKILIPILRKSSSQATLDELLSMRSEPLLRSDETIQFYIEQKVKDSSLFTLLSIDSKNQEQWCLDLIESEIEEKFPNENLENLLRSKDYYKSRDEQKTAIIERFDNFIAKQVKEEIEGISFKKIFKLMYLYKDRFFIDLVESSLEKKISTTNLGDLLEEKLIYKLIDEPKDNIINLFNNSINQQVKTAYLDHSLNKLLDQIRHSSDDAIVDQLIEALSKSDVLERIIDVLIHRFASSTSFNSAGSNTELLIKFAEYLSPTQWDKILVAFLKNNQLYDSFSCFGGIASLFNKSLELNNFVVQPYWLNFREKLNKLNSQHCNGLKQLIDSYIS